MSVHSLIFRIDFRKTNYEIIDSPGRIMSIFSSMGENCWNEFADGQSTRAVTANFAKDNALYRQVTIEPTSINFALETKKPIELSTIDRDENYILLMKSVTQLCDEFKIHELRRAGLRTISLNSICDNKDLKPLFSRVYDGDIITSTESILGKGTDFGVVIDGEDKDKISYHLKFGPYSKDESSKYFPKLNKSIGELDNNLIFDIDLYEENFALTIKPAKWASSLLLKSSKFKGQIEKSLTGMFTK